MHELSAEHASSAEVACYEHDTLNHDAIRLFKVRRDDQGLIHCDIQPFNLEQAPPFNTLSYVWGSSKAMRSVFINNRPLEIRKGLYSFFTEFCGGDEYLWADQVSIAQKNVEERNHQVRLMSSIYRQCTSVIVWLGGGAKKYLRAALDFEATSSISSMATLLHHTYFTRLWVIQEVLIPPEVQIFVGGSTWVSWLDFVERVLGSQRQLEAHGVSYTALALVNNRNMQTGQKTISLETCIQLFSGNDCGDARDKVYGLMGLVHVTERVDVDYSKSTHEVYLDVVRTFCRHYLDHQEGSRVDSGNVCDSYHLTLAELGKSMGFHYDQVVGLICFLSELFHRLEEREDADVETKGQRALAIGFQVMDDADESRPSQWWFEWKGERRFF